MRAWQCASCKSGGDETALVLATTTLLKGHVPTKALAVLSR